MIGYDWVRFVEHLPDGNPDELELPDLFFVFPETVVAFDNVKHSALIVRHIALANGEDARAAYRRESIAIDAVAARLREPLPALPRQPVVRQPMDVIASHTPEQYQDAVKRAREYIEAGDIFQVVLGQRWRMPLQVDPFSIYRQLRRVDPSPYLFFLRCEGAVLIGASPEILVRLRGDTIEVRPLAGTRRRGRTPEEDLAMERELLADPKERAEHVMLVDLGRNAVGRVAPIGSVKVTELATIERYSHVAHIVSHVEGKRARASMASACARPFPPAR